MTYANWTAWRNGSAQDAHSVLANPLLLDPANAKFELRPKSPAINLGAPDFASASGETDHDGRPRVNGARTDVGALEFDLLHFSSGGNSEPLQLTLSGGEARLSLRRRTDSSSHSLSYQVQTSTTLNGADWSVPTATAPVVGTPLLPADGTERAVFSFTPPTASRWFARVKIDVLP